MNKKKNVNYIIYIFYLLHTRLIQQSFNMLSIWYLYHNIQFYFLINFVCYFCHTILTSNTRSFRIVDIESLYVYIREKNSKRIQNVNMWRITRVYISIRRISLDLLEILEIARYNSITRKNKLYKKKKKNNRIIIINVRNNQIITKEKFSFPTVDKTGMVYLFSIFQNH